MLEVRLDRLVGELKTILARGLGVDPTRVSILQMGHFKDSMTLADAQVSRQKCYFSYTILAQGGALAQGQPNTHSSGGSVSGSLAPCAPTQPPLTRHLTISTNTHAHAQHPCPLPHTPGAAQDGCRHWRGQGRWQHRRRQWHSGSVQQWRVWR